MVQSDSNRLERGLTPNEFARVYRLGPDRVRSMIARGELQAINTAKVRCGKPRWVIMPWHAQQWEESRRAVVIKSPRRRRKRVDCEDFYPD